MSKVLRPRRLFLHAAHTHVGVATPGTPRQNAAPAVPGLEEDVRAVRVCLGDAAGEAMQSLLLLADALTDVGALQCCWASDELPDREEPDDWDCLVLLDRPALDDPQSRARIDAHCRAGRPVVALGEAAWALPDWPGFALDVLGAELAPPRHRLPLPVEPLEAVWFHPVLEGVGPLVGWDDPWRQVRLAEDATVLMTSHWADHSAPVAWTRQHRGGRVFATTLGHPRDFAQQAFLRLLVNAVDWACEGSALPW